MLDDAAVVVPKVGLVGKDTIGRRNKSLVKYSNCPTGGVLCNQLTYKHAPSKGEILNY